MITVQTVCEYFMVFKIIFIYTFQRNRSIVFKVYVFYVSSIVLSTLVFIINDFTIDFGCDDESAADFTCLFFRPGPCAYASKYSDLHTCTCINCIPVAFYVGQFFF